MCLCVFVCVCVCVDCLSILLSFCRLSARFVSVCTRLHVEALLLIICACLPVCMSMCVCACHWMCMHWSIHPWAHINFYLTFSFLLSDIESLRRKVFQNTQAKSGMHGEMLTGAGLSRLLRYLVDAANTNSFPSVPSVSEAGLFISIAHHTYARTHTSTRIQAYSGNMDTLGRCYEESLADYCAIWWMLRIQTRFLRSICEWIHLFQSYITQTHARTYTCNKCRAQEDFNVCGLCCKFNKSSFFPSVPSVCEYGPLVSFIHHTNARTRKNE